MRGRNNMKNCDCNLTGGCPKCNPIFDCYPVNDNKVKVEISRQELLSNNYDWRDCDQPLDPIVVMGKLTDKKETAFMT